MVEWVKESEDRYVLRDKVSVELLGKATWEDITVVVERAIEEDYDIIDKCGQCGKGRHLRTDHEYHSSLVLVKYEGWQVWEEMDRAATISFWDDLDKAKAEGERLMRFCWEVVK